MQDEDVCEGHIIRVFFDGAKVCEWTLDGTDLGEQCQCGRGTVSINSRPREFRSHTNPRKRWYVLAYSGVTLDDAIPRGTGGDFVDDGVRSYFFV